MMVRLLILDKAATRNLEQGTSVVYKVKVETGAEAEAEAEAGAIEGTWAAFTGSRLKGKSLFHFRC